MNSAQKIIYNLQMERFEVFKAQNPEDADSDVMFEIDGKNLYANKYLLSSVSSTFKTMLSDQWTKPNVPVMIDGHSFDDFKEFLTFLYSGSCEINNDNILAMLDMSEFYDVKVFKEVCAKFLTKIDFSLCNIYELFELTNIYTIGQLKKAVDKYIAENFSMVFKNDKFLNLQKSTVKNLVETNKETEMQEDLFEGVYNWAEKQALEKVELNESLNLHETIKEELSEFMPFMKFEKMSSFFLIKFVLKKSFLFSGDELSDIFWARNKNKTFVKVIDENGKIMKGELQCDDVEAVANVIESVKNETCHYYPYDHYYHWSTWTVRGQAVTWTKRPSTPSKIIKNDKIDWYLVYTGNHGNLAIRNRNDKTDFDYLLAKMTAEDGFKLSEDCKIGLC